VNFLLNMNLPRSLGKSLKAMGHAYRHAGDIGLSQATDAEIMAEAERQREVILTHDLDYGHLLAFSGDRAPSVVIFRMRDCQTDKLYARLTQAWQEIDRPLEEGAIVILEDAATRIRKLPILSLG